MKSVTFFAILLSLACNQSLAQSRRVLLCSEPGDSRVVELNLGTMVARLMVAGSTQVEEMKYIGTDSGWMNFEGPVHVFDFNFREGSRRGIGNSNLANRNTSQTMWCNDAK